MEGLRTALLSYQKALILATGILICWWEELPNGGIAVVSVWLQFYERAKIGRSSLSESMKL